MKVENSAHIDGVFKGELLCSGSMTIGPAGAVWADLEGEEIYIHGMVHGTVHAEKVQLNSQARFIGDIYTRTLSIFKGAVFQGRSMAFDEEEQDDHNKNAVLPLGGVGLAVHS